MKWIAFTDAMCFVCFFYILRNSLNFLVYKTLRGMHTMCIGRLRSSCTSVRKAEQVPQGLRDIGSTKRTCPLSSFIEAFVVKKMD